MAFLNPALLFGLAAVSIPVIIHLLNRRRFRRVRWAAMRFLKISMERNQRRMKMEDLLLLLLRCALVALLALALARPTIEWLKSGFLGSKVSTVIVLDRSGSMTAEAGNGKSKFDLARDAALETLDSLPNGSAVAVLLSADAPDGGVLEPTLDLKLARRILEEAGPADRPTDLLPALRKGMDILGRESSADKELILITDGQAEGWRQFEPILTQMDDGKKKTARLSVVFVGQETTGNLGLSALRQVSALSPVDQPIRFEIDVTNYGTTTVENVPVTLTVDGAESGEPFVIDTLPAGETKNATLFTKLASEGYHRVSAAIPADAMPSDDSRTLVLRATGQLRVLLVDGDPGRSPLDSETFFVRNALMPVMPDMAADYFIQAETVPVADLAGVQFDDFTCVVLANVSELPSETVEALKAFARAGGGVVIFPGDNINASFYNREMFDAEPRFLPTSLGDTISADGGKDSFLTLQASGYDHPMVALWSDPGSGSLATARIFRAYTLAPAADDPGARVVLRFSNGAPAVAERDFGLGRVYLFASTADTAWTNLPVHPAFLPMMHRVVGSVVGRRDEGLNFPAGQAFYHRLEPRFSGAEAMIYPLADGQAKGALHTVTDGPDGVPVLSFDDTGRAGAYEVNISDPPALLQFAVQPDASESRLETLSAEQRERVGQSATVINWPADSGFADALRRQRSGAELWILLLVAALVAGTLEMILAQRFSRPK
jgi:hypothetical protein